MRVGAMDETPQFDMVRFKAATAVFRLGYAEYNKGIGARERMLPDGWIESPEKPTRMIHSDSLREAVRYFDICLNLLPDLAGANLSASTALNLKVLTLRALGDFEAADKAQVLAAAKKVGNKQYQADSDEGLNYCNEPLAKTLANRCQLGMAVPVPLGG